MLARRSLAVIEAIIGGSSAVVVEVLNVLFFEKSNAGHVLAFGLALGGILLSVQRGAIERATEKELAPLRALAAFVDVGRLADYSPVSALHQSYSSIVEPEFAPLKANIVTDATAELKKLLHEKRSTTLQTGDYYDWLFAQFKVMEKNNYVHAISLSSDDEWNDSELEKNFFEVNRLAGERGVAVTRIFVVERARLPAFLKLPPIDAHTAESKVKLSGRWVAREELQRLDPQLLKSLNEGFIDFNGRVGLEDRIDPTGAARGDVTLNPDDLQRMQRLYERVFKMSAPLGRQSK